MSATAGRHIWGVLAPGGRISRNNNGYLPEELERWDGQIVPLFFDHEDFEVGKDGRHTGKILTPRPRGQVKTIWNEDMKRLEYDGRIYEDPGDRQFVSLAGEPTHFETFHGERYAIGLKPISVSVVKNPGIPETTVNLEMSLSRMREDGNFQYYEISNSNKCLVMLESKIDNSEVYNGNAQNGMPSSQVNEFPTAPAPQMSQPQPNQQPMNGMCPHGLMECPQCKAEDMQRQLGAQNAQTSQTGPGYPGLRLQQPAGPAPNPAAQMPQPPMPRPPGFGTGVGPQVGVNADPHLGGTGAVGVSGTSNITPMAGQNVNPPMGPRVQNPYLQRTEALVKEDNAKQGTPDMSSVQEGNVSSMQDENTTKGHSVGVKSIGLAQTPYEELILAKVAKGEQLTEQEKMAYESMITREKKIQTLDMGTVASNPERVSSIPTKESDDKKDMDAEEELTSKYGYSKEFVSTLSRTEARKLLREQTLIAVKNAEKVSDRTEARTSALGNTASNYVVNGFDLSFPDVAKHLDNMAMLEKTGDVKHLYSHVPFLNPPRVEKGEKALERRMGFVNAIEGFTDLQRNIVSEAIATTTSGAAMGVQANTPALIIPTNLSAVLRDTVYFQQVQQGYNTARFQTITVPAAGALTQNTEPSQATQTMATVDIAPTPRGVEQQISFEAERKIMGPILEGVILSFRLSELYDEDFLLLGASQAFESSVVTSGTGINGQSTGYQFFGGGSTYTSRASEATIISTDVMGVSAINLAVAQLQTNGYSTDNLVWVGAPAQYRALLTDANTLRMVSFGPNTDNGRSMLAQGVIPELIGAELRRSTLGVSGTGSAAIVTYHSWLYKKGLTAAMAASRDLMIETFRDIRVNSTWVKGHWDLKCNVLHPNSLIELVTA